MGDLDVSSLARFLKSGPRLLFVVNDAGFFLSHRLPIAEKARQQGYDVQVATAPGKATKDIAQLGFAMHELPISRSGRHVIREIVTLAALVSLFRRVRPDIVHLVTIKPVIYGGIAARIAQVPAVVSAVSGLGTVFLARGALARLVRVVVTQLYRVAFGHPNLMVIFQNTDDRNAFVEQAIVPGGRTIVIPGSGVDLSDFPVQPEPESPVVVTMTSRLLHDKGVDEFVEAAASIRDRRPDIVFQLAGDLDPGNRTSLTREEYERIDSGGQVRLLGHRRDIAALLAKSSIVVLPSYREGLPKALVEAAAAGRAVVTTDVPGCRDAIMPGISGLLVPPGDSVALALAIESLIVDPGKRALMGMAGRQLAESTFGIDTNVKRHLAIYSTLMNRAP